MRDVAELVRHSQRTLRRACRNCGATDLYWAHDTAQDGELCNSCSVYGPLVLTERDGSRHTCSDGEPPNQAQVSDEQDPWVQVDDPVGSAAQRPATGGSEAQALDALRALLGVQIDRAEVESIVRGVFDQTVFPTRMVVQLQGQEPKDVEGPTHYALADVTTAVLAGEHVLMVGPAGTGKSTIAEQAAEALGLDSYSLSLSPQTPVSQILGYMQAMGEYVPTLFRWAYENGGLFHFDELDNAHPSVLAVVNSALVNGHMAFPDRMVERHPDFRCVGSANTYGRGATRAYVGRQAIDAATLDRFTVLTVNVDEALENRLVDMTGVEATLGQRVLKYVRKVRAKAESEGLSLVVSPRASVGMARLLAAGMSWEAAVDARVRRGLDDDTWSKIR